MVEFLRSTFHQLGGAGSGNYGHAGRPGRRGGSAPGDRTTVDKPSEEGGPSATTAKVSRDNPSRPALDSNRTLRQKHFFTDTTGRGTPSYRAERMKTITNELLVAKLISNEKLKTKLIDRYGATDSIGSSREDRAKALVRIETAMAVNDWAKTSGDHEDRSIAIQRAVAEEFELKNSELSHLKPSRESVMTGGALTTESLELRKPIVRAMYEETQAKLAELGIKELVLFRGATVPKDQIPNGTKLGVRDIDMRLQPASSFSLDPTTAVDFATGAVEHGSTNTPVLMMMRVPAADILSFPGTGFGCLREEEVVVLGGERRAKVMTGLIDEDGSPSRVAHKIDDFSDDEMVQQFDEVQKRGSVRDRGEDMIADFERKAKANADDELIISIDVDLANADWPKRTQDAILPLTKLDQPKVNYHQLGGAGSGNFGHSGRPGEVGGSAKGEDTENEKTATATKSASAKITSEEQVPYIEKRRGGTIRERGYFIMPDGELIDVNSDFGGGTNDHVGIIAFAERPERFGVDKALAKRLVDELESGSGDYIVQPEVWQKVWETGAVRVREFQFAKDSKTIIAVDFGEMPNPVAATKRLINEGKIPADARASYSIESVVSGVSEYDISLADILEGNRGMRTHGGAGSGHFGHAGRPGQRGGSAKSGESDPQDFRPTRRRDTAAQHDKDTTRQLRKRYDSDPEFRAVANVVSAYTGGYFIPVRQASAALRRGWVTEQHTDADKESVAKMIIQRGNSAANHVVKDADLLIDTNPLHSEVAKLNRAVAEAPVQDIPLFRGVPQSPRHGKSGDIGMEISADTLKEFQTKGEASLGDFPIKTGDVLKVAGVASFSTDPKIADAFSVGRATGQPEALRYFIQEGLVFELEPGARALDVSGLSDWKQSEMLTFGQFQVTSVEAREWEPGPGDDQWADPRVITHIKLKQLTTDYQDQQPKANRTYDEESELVRALFGEPMTELDRGQPGPKANFKVLGGAGSGNFGHAGRPGEIGGSSKTFDVEVPPFPQAKGYHWTIEYHTGEPRPLYRSVSPDEYRDFQATGKLMGGGNAFNSFDPRRDEVFFADKMSDMLVGQGEETERQVEHKLLESGMEAEYRQLKQRAAAAEQRLTEQLDILNRWRASRGKMALSFSKDHERLEVGYGRPARKSDLTGRSDLLSLAKDISDSNTKAAEVQQRFHDEKQRLWKERQALYDAAPEDQPTSYVLETHPIRGGRVYVGAFRSEDQLNEVSFLRGQITREMIAKVHPVHHKRVLTDRSFSVNWSSGVRALGGAGSGHFGHDGRPGEVGGSAPGKVVMHGTSAKAMRKILAEGITPGHQPQWAESRGTPKRNNSVYVLDTGLRRIPDAARLNLYDLAGDDGATIVAAAEMYARQAAAPNSKPVVVVAVLPPRTKLEPDAVVSTSLTGGRSAKMVSKVAPEHIVGYFEVPDHWKPSPPVFKRLAVAEGSVVLIPLALETDDFKTLGGTGSGNFGHAGRPGQVGGSAPSEGAARAEAFVKEKLGDKAHAGDSYNKHAHSSTVAAQLAGESDEVVKAAWLHDTLEDSDATYEQLRDQFGERTANIVRTLTWDKEHEPYAEYIKRVAADPDASKIKMADLQDNMILSREESMPPRMLEHKWAASEIVAARMEREGTRGTPLKAEDPRNDPFRGLDGSHSVMRHIGPDGRLTPERQAFHNFVVAKVLADKPTQDAPTYTMFGGGPAAGKSTVLKTGAVTLPEGSVVVDADAIKKMLPDFGLSVRAGDKGASTFVHEESSMLAARAQKEAFKERMNVVLDGTGDTTADKVASKIDKARAAGYVIDAVYCTVPIEDAIARAEARATTGSDKGRFVPPELIKSIHAEVSRIFPQIANQFDTARLYDTTTKQPVLVASAKRGQAITIHDQSKWDAFIARGTNS